MAVEGWRTDHDVVWHPDDGEHPHHDGTLFGTEQLSPAETERLLRLDNARLVVWMGVRGTGKTTLCTELYERQRLAVDGARFAGSWTLLAFEQLAYRRRTTGESVPATRSGLDPEGREILHLALSAGETPLHLLFVDVSGDVFRRLADNQVPASEIPWLDRAHKLVLLVDGERLVDAAARSGTLTRVRQLVERLQACNLPRAGARLALLVTKWDVLRTDHEATAYWGSREAELLSDLRAIDPDALALRVGAADSAPHDGFAELRAWLLESTARREEVADLWQEPVSVEQRPEEPAPIQFEWPAEKPRRSWLPWRRRR